MSELTLCNYCSLAGLRRRARQDGQRVLLMPARREDKYYMGGWDVYRFPKSMWTIPEFKRLEPEAQGNWRVCWFMEISDRCVC